MNGSISLRVKDIIVLGCVTVGSLIFTYFFRDFFPIRWERPFIFIWYILLLFPLYIGYLESRDNDPLVTGKTQRYGVSNSFTVLTALIVIISHGIWNWLCVDLIACVLMFAAREYGRRVRDKWQKEYIGQEVYLLDDLPGTVKAQMKEKVIKVSSKKEIKRGTTVVITELKGKYLYVEKKE